MTAEDITDEADLLVCIVFLQGQDYEDAVDAINDQGGSTQAAVEHLSQWDYGSENDAAATVNNNGYDRHAEVESRPHHIGAAGGLTYWLAADHIHGTCALYRRPLTRAA